MGPALWLLMHAFKEMLAQAVGTQKSGVCKVCLSNGGFFLVRLAEASMNLLTEVIIYKHLCISNFQGNEICFLFTYCVLTV